ncbi:RidA family protein [Homoserinimonas sp. OAct 916]|uniref:RidA family protein n=1 Tax=Homoserinimonas sp. OAct 916 TaxID=2211450 RepID=UPI0018E4E36B|nr:RidA family protein [Homoserinimonas sp. OAct 916]
MNTVDNRIASGEIKLPRPPAPAANYVGAVEQGGFLDVSGQIHTDNGELKKGKVGADVTLEEAIGMARIASENALAVAHSVRGSLDGLRVHRLRVYVVGAEGFHEQHLVGNGASDYLIEVFRELGTHSRTSVGVAALPFGAAVEVELTFQVAS